ncbi:MAG: hydrolase [Gammaproteobacteria bacterium]|nr:hydrolase [Gammaproteobacteria bacterium]
MSDAQEMEKEALKEEVKSQVEEVCACPETYPDWDGKQIDLGGTCVHEMKIAAFFHMPVAYDMYVSKQAANIDHLDLKEKWPGLILTKTGWFGGKIMRLLEDSESPSRLVHYLPGSFWVQCQLHHGGIGTVPKAVHKMQIEMVEKGFIPKEFYLAHLTCPVCVERKGGEDKILIVRRFVANKRIQDRLQKEAEKQARKAEKVAKEVKAPETAEA